MRGQEPSAKSRRLGDSFNWDEENGKSPNLSSDVTANPFNQDCISKYDINEITVIFTW